MFKRTLLVGRTFASSKQSNKSRLESSSSETNPVNTCVISISTTFVLHLFCFVFLFFFFFFLCAFILCLFVGWLVGSFELMDCRANTVFLFFSLNFVDFTPFSVI